MFTVCSVISWDSQLNSQETKMKAFEIEARAINAVTKMMAEKEGVNIWRQVQVQVSVLLVSPEMLSMPGFENLL